jgi:hypothetical protein
MEWSRHYEEFPESVTDTEATYRTDTCNCP